MSKLYTTVSSCLLKKPVSEQTEVITSDKDVPDDIDDVKENDANELSSDKKTDEVVVPAQQSGMFWRLTSGLYSTTTGAVSYGYGGVKWVAGKGYDAGSSVVSTGLSVATKIKNVPLKRKAKNE